MRRSVPGKQVSVSPNNGALGGPTIGTPGVVERTGKEGRQVLLRRRPDDLSLMPGFWELPETAGAEVIRRRIAGEFRHAITHHAYTVRVIKGKLRGAPPDGYQWVNYRELLRLPLATITRKALLLGAGQEALAPNRPA
jgi:hypothetical protein